ncbi:hypothetical protein M8J75_003493 [Diaphorina citri]|nr:hypothetical protein M8J75_003493 [Diaphorina citri]
MVYEFSFEELTDIHFCYGLADGNANLARRLYQDKYPNRHLPNNRTFTSVHTRLRERGTFKTNHGGNSGRERTTREVHVEEDILEAVDNDPTISTREISVNLGISQSAVWRTLHENLFYPYHLQRVQGLLERDFGPRLQFSRWVLVQIATVLNFVSSILFTDEANFSRDGITNFHNNHIWAMENPHGIVQKNHQQTFSWNVWAGIIGDTLLGPFFLPPILNGDNYLDFLREHLMDMIPLEYRQREIRQGFSNVFGNPFKGVWKPALNPEEPILNTFCKLCSCHVPAVLKGLLERDFGPRLQFSRWVLVQIATVLNFVSSILFTDEANFSRDGITNFHNNHIWAMENPHGIVQKNHQQTFSWNVWAGIIGDTLLGPFFLPPILNGDNYLDFLREHLMDMIPLEYRQREILALICIKVPAVPGCEEASAKDILYTSKHKSTW